MVKIMLEKSVSQIPGNVVLFAALFFTFLPMELHFLVSK